MQSQSTAQLQQAFRQRHGVEFVEFFRTHHWASFSALPVVAERCGMTPDELARLMAEEAWQLQKPPALARQNQPVADLTLLGAVAHSETCLDTFVCDFKGTPAAAATQVTCRVAKDLLHLRVACAEERMDDIDFAAHGPTDPDAKSLWAGDTEALKDTAAWQEGPDRFREWARAVGGRQESIFTDDCLMITLTAVSAGDCPAYLAPVRHARNPLAMLANPPSRSSAPRVHMEGSYYYIAVAPTGQVVGAFHDPWDGGVFWPCWRSGATASVSRTDEGWGVDLTVPLANLEPLAVHGSVWGVDVFRRRPARGAESAEWTRSADSIFFRQTGNDLGEGRFLSTTEEFGAPGIRHAYIASELPFVDRIEPRDVPSMTVRRSTDDHPDDPWRDAAEVSDFWLDQTGAAPVSRTAVRVAYDREFLNVRFVCHDRDTANLRVVSKEEELAKYGAGNRRANYLDRREAFGLDWGDYVEVMLAPGIPGADIHHGGTYTILVNSRGDVLKRYCDPYGACALGEDSAWGPRLRIEIQIQDDRWEASLRIPLSSLHNADQATDTWRANFRRARGARNTASPDCKGSEISAWSPEYGRCRLLERWGHLHFDGPLPQARTAGRVVVSGDTDEGVKRRTSPTAADDTLVSIHFPTPDMGWAVGGLGTIRHTSDGGATWDTQPVDADYALEKVFLLDEARGFAVGGRPRSQGIAIEGTAGIILVTADGGENWCAAFKGSGAHLFDLSFASDRVGYAVGGYGLVLKTTDGGTSWQHMANTGTDRWLLAVHFVDEYHGWAAGEDGLAIVTSDGGHSWQCCAAPTADQPFGMSAALRSIHFLDRHEGWAAGDRGTFLHTLDGGRTWEAVDLGLSFPAADVVHFSDLRFSDSRTGILVGMPGAIVFRTEDGGCTWGREKGSNPSALRGACFAPQGQAWAVGEFGTIARCTNGCWEQVAGSQAKPRVLYGTPHGHHVKSTCWAAMAEDHGIAMAIGGRSINLSGHYAERTRANTIVGCLEAGMRAVRSMLDMPGGRRREPHRICHIYQNWQGIEIAERRLTAIIRSIRPQIVITEWPLLQEGYWAADVGLFARALIRAFDSAADPERFPELAELGLLPWQAEKLYACHRSPFSEVYRIGERKDWTVSARESDMTTALGMRIGEARYRGACSWLGLLDRARPRSPGPVGDYVYRSSFHLLKDNALGEDTPSQ